MIMVMRMYTVYRNRREEVEWITHLFLYLFEHRSFVSLNLIWILGFEIGFGLMELSLGYGLG